MIETTCAGCGVDTGGLLSCAECEKKVFEGSGLWWKDLGDSARHLIVAIEYHKRRPFNVVTIKHGLHRDGQEYRCPQHFDFEWCRRDKTLYYHNSGSGGDLSSYHVSPCCKPDPPPVEIWAEHWVQFVRYQDLPGVRDEYGNKNYTYVPVAPEELLAFGYKRRGSPRGNPFVDAEEGECEYCAVCNDHLPSDDVSAICDHKRWCDDCGMWTYNNRRYKGINQNDLCNCLMKRKRKARA